MPDINNSLGRLPQLSVLFKELSHGKHINRLSDPALWAELEKEAAAYQALFTALGYELRIDGRGYAWFHTEESSHTISNTSRKLALLFMVIFDTQADEGKPLLRFSDWVIDRPLLKRVHEQHQELLNAEGLDIDDLMNLLESASRFGFVRKESGHWQLLPAVCRYLDHFEALASENRDQEASLVLSEDVLKQEQS